jgi:hypothetical protein
VRAATERESRTECERQADDALSRHLSNEPSFKPRYDALTDPGFVRQTPLRKAGLVSTVSEASTDHREVGMERLLALLRLVRISLLM